MNLTVTKLEELEAAYQEYGDIRQSAEATGINYDKARRALIEAGVHEVSKNSGAKKRERIFRLCEEGLSARDIAARVGLSDASIRRILRARGMKLTRVRRFRAAADKLGTMPDGALAKIEGVSRQAIRQRRELRGIPPYRGGGR